MNFAETWGLLESEGGAIGLSGRIQRRIIPEGRRNVFLGLEVPSGNRMLILRVASNSLLGQSTPLDSRGLTVRTNSGDHQVGSTEVEIVLTDTQHRDIFDLLVRDLVESAEQPEDEGVGVARLMARLSNWQQLLRRLSPRGLSRRPGWVSGVSCGSCGRFSHRPSASPMPSAPGGGPWEPIRTSRWVRCAWR